MSDPQSNAEVISLDTDAMVADILSKPLVGKVFNRHTASLRGGFDPSTLIARPLRSDISEFEDA